MPFIEETRKWIEEVVIGCNFCPFAARELKADTIHYRVETGSDRAALQRAVLDECAWLDQEPATETSLVIFPNALAELDEYLDFLALCERSLLKRGYESVYQLASFHPRYQFAQSAYDDPANYTNRSPYPMLHLLREESLERALERYPDPEGIPERNILYARSKGAEHFEALLASCGRKSQPLRHLSQPPADRGRAGSRRSRRSS